MTRISLIMLATMVGVISAQAAGFDCSRFKKNDDGTWGAVQATELGGPTGRIDFTPGEIYKEGETRKGLDIAKLLNANCDKK
jgi:hypothetical protein